MTNFAGCLVEGLTLNTMKKLVGLWIVMIGFAFGACHKEERPANVLPPDEMAKVLVDIYLAEARLNDSPVDRDSAIRYFIPHQSKILERHNISDSLVIKSFQYYIDHPRQFEKIYESVIDTLNLREQKLRTGNEVK